MAGAIGFSVGAANLVAVVVGHAAVTRSAVLTRFAHRPPEVGLPSENPDLDERGLIIADFVERVGDPVPVVASDGSSHLAADVVADALQSLLYVATGGRAPVEPIGVAYPAHWRQPAVDALRAALAAVPEFCKPRPVLLMPDAVAALTALQDDPGVPPRGIIAVCDFGASGTSVTFADAARGFQPIAATVRDGDLSGDAIDRALLTRVVGDLASAGVIDLSNPSEIGPLSRLRGQCRTAKERLSTSPVTSLTIDLPGRRTEVHLTRNELDDAIAQPLAGFFAVFHDALQRSGIRISHLVAVASIGAEARTPVVTAALAEQLRVPVITTGHPELSAAIGSGLMALRQTIGAGVGSAAAIAPRLAEHSPDPLPALDAGSANPRPRIEFGGDDFHDDDEGSPWYRHPFALLAGGVGVVLAATAVAAVLVLVRDDSPGPISTVSSTSQAPKTTDPQPLPLPPTLSSNVIPPPPPPPSPIDVPAPTTTEEAPPPSETPAVLPIPETPSLPPAVPPPGGVLPP